MNTRERDQYICQDYLEGKEARELARSYGLSDRRISQILQAHGVVRRTRNLSKKRSLSALHSRVGLKLYTYRFELGVEPAQAALELGWSMIKLRKVERGQAEVELLDLVDIAAYTQIPLDQLLAN